MDYNTDNNKMFIYNGYKICILTNHLSKFDEDISKSRKIRLIDFDTNNNKIHKYITH
jgi:hypothetical protein